MRIISDLAGTMLSYFKVGTLALKDSSGTLEARNRADSAYAPITCSSLTLNPDNSVALVHNTPHWVKITVPYSGFTTGSSQTITLFTLPAGGWIHGLTVKHSTPFAGGAIDGYTVSCGISSNHTKYSAAFDVYQAVTNLAYQDSTTQGSENFGASVAITITATVTGDTLGNATAGSLDVWALLSVRA